MGNENTDIETIVKRIINDTDGMEYDDIVKYLEQNQEFIQLISNSKDAIMEMLRSKRARSNLIYAVDNFESTQGKQEADELIKQHGLKKVLEDRILEIDQIPIEYRQELYDLAVEYEKNGIIAFARVIYEYIVECGKSQAEKYFEKFDNDRLIDTVYYKAVFSYLRCKTKNGEELTEKDRKLKESMLGENAEEVKVLVETEKLDPEEVFMGLLEGITIQELKEKVRPHSPSGDGPKIPRGERKDRTRHGNLSADRILEHIMTYGVSKAFHQGGKNFSGEFAFELEGTDVLIVERFYDSQYEDGTYYLREEAATYVIKKSVLKELVSEIIGEPDLSISKIIDTYKKSSKGEGDNRIQRIEHRSRYYENLDAAVEQMTGMKIQQTGRPILPEEITELVEENTVVELNGEPIEITPDISEVEVEETAEVEEPVVEVSEEEPAIEEEPIVEISEEEPASEVVEEIEEEPVIEMVPENGEENLTSEELLERIAELDESISEIETKRNELSSNISELRAEVLDIVKQLRTDVDAFVTSENRAKMKEQLQTLGAAKELLREAEEAIQDLQEQERAKREKRGELAKRFKDGVSGSDNPDGR